MKLEGIGIMDLEHQAEWAAHFLMDVCHVEDRLYEWELCKLAGGRRVTFSFDNACDEWLYGLEQAWQERYPNDEIHVDHAQRFRVPKGVAETYAEVWGAGGVDYVSLATKRQPTVWGVKAGYVQWPKGMGHMSPKLADWLEQENDADNGVAGSMSFLLDALRAQRKQAVILDEPL